MSDVPPVNETLTPEEENRALAGEYVLGLLEGQELRAFEERLGAEPSLRALVARWSEDFVAGLGDLPAVMPPARTQTALMRRLFPEPEPKGLLGRMGLWPLLLGGAVAAALVVLAVNPALVGRGVEPEFQARMAAEDESLVVLARYDADTRRLEVERTAGEIPEGRDLELWVIKDDRVRSLGVIPRDAEGVIEVSEELAPDFEGGQLALTDEPLGGSPTGVATGDIKAAGPITEL